MKKWFAVLLTLALLCGMFVGCGNDDFPAPVDMESAPESTDDLQDHSLPLLNVCVDVPSSRGGAHGKTS